MLCPWPPTPCSLPRFTVPIRSKPEQLPCVSPSHVRYCYCFSLVAANPSFSAFRPGRFAPCFLLILLDSIDFVLLLFFSFVKLRLRQFAISQSQFQLTCTLLNWFSGVESLSFWQKLYDASAVRACCTFPVKGVGSGLPLDIYGQRVYLHVSTHDFSSFSCFFYTITMMVRTQTSAVSTTD